MGRDVAVLDPEDLKVSLMEQAEPLRIYLERKIPAQHRATIAAEDILQEVWIAAFRNLATFVSTEPNSLAKWLQRITERKLLDALRNARRVKRGGRDRVEEALGRRSSSYLDLFHRVRRDQRTPSSEAAAREAVTAVQIALVELPDNCRQAVTFHHIYGQSQSEVAGRMRKTVPAVNSLLYRGLRLLRDQMAQP